MLPAEGQHQRLHHCQRLHDNIFIIHNQQKKGSVNKHSVTSLQQETMRVEGLILIINFMSCESLVCVGVYKVGM